MVEIKELVLRIPGTGKEEGRRLAKDVSDVLAANLPRNIDLTSIDHVNIRIGNTGNLHHGSLAGRLARSIIRDIRQRSKIRL